MALASCRECGAQISTTAWRCPKCGGSTLRRPSRRVETLCIFFFLGMIALAMYAGEPGDGYLAFAIFGALPMAIAWLSAQQRER
jgi:hypothetical protein